MHSSKSQEFWLPVTDYPRANPEPFVPSPEGSQAYGTRLILDHRAYYISGQD